MVPLFYTAMTWIATITHQLIVIFNFVLDSNLNYINIINIELYRQIIMLEPQQTYFARISLAEKVSHILI